MFWYEWCFLTSSWDAHILMDFGCNHKWNFRPCQQMCWKFASTKNHIAVVIVNLVWLPYIALHLLECVIDKFKSILVNNIVIFEQWQVNHANLIRLNQDQELFATQFLAKLDTHSRLKVLYAVDIFFGNNLQFEPHNMMLIRQVPKFCLLFYLKNL